MVHQNKFKLFRKFSTNITFTLAMKRKVPPSKFVSNIAPILTPNPDPDLLPQQPKQHHSSYQMDHVKWATAAGGSDTSFNISNKQWTAPVNEMSRPTSSSSSKDPLPINYGHKINGNEFKQKKVEREVVHFAKSQPLATSSSAYIANYSRDRSNLFQNESVQFFANLKTMYSSKMSGIRYIDEPRDPSLAFFKSETMRQEVASQRKPQNIPTYSMMDWNCERDYRHLFYNNPLGVKWSCEAAYMDEMYRLPLRNWESTNLGKIVGSRDSSGVTGDGVRFTVMCYNVLSPKLLDAHMYLYNECEPEALEWENRKRAFFAEIDMYKPDIICMQEIDSSLLLSVYDKFFAREGYKGVFKKRTGDKEDGCAIYFRDSKFRLVDSLKVECFQPHVPILDRDNVGILVKLQAKRGRKHKFVVGTTHLLYNPKRLDIKLAQAQLMLAELDRFSFYGFDRAGHPLYHPTIMTGDFNTEPYSAISRLFTEGKLRHLDENGKPVLTMRRRGADEFIPPYLGISDQCQHYRLVHARIKCQKIKKTSTFELEAEASKTFTNVFQSEDFLPFAAGESGLVSPVAVTEVATTTDDLADIDTILSSTPSIETVGSDNSIAGKATPQTPLQKSSSIVINKDVNSPLVHPHVVEAILKAGTVCTFGSGEFSHRFHFRNVYASRLDREGSGGTDESIATTRQNGWICVDYIYYSTVWNEQFGKRIEGKLKLLRRLGLLSKTQCREIGSIPRRDIPSDHFPLVAEFILKN